MQTFLASSIWSNRILKEMNRLHTREEYMTLIDKIELLFQTALFHRYDYRFLETETIKIR
jgi:tRNA-2-methylthio-N6-dimethylallyladenosine synthase